MQSPFAQVVEAEAPGTGLAVPLGDVNEVFKPGGSTAFVQAVEEHVATLKPQLDISTETGREFIRSTAYKITRTKTYAFAKAKELSGALKAKAKEIDTEANHMSGELTKLSHEIRGPLTAWEDRDAKRAGDYELKLGEIYNACLFVGAPTIEAIQSRMAKLRSYQSIGWQEYRERAETGFAECFPALQAMLAKAEKDEADRVELEELRAMKVKLPGRGTIMHDSPAVSYEDPNACPICDKVWDRHCCAGCGYAVAKQDGEAIPPRAEMKPLHTITLEAVRKSEIDLEFCWDLRPWLDYDQAQDVLDAIKAGKIRHVQIVY